MGWLERCVAEQAEGHTEALNILLDRGWKLDDISVHGLDYQSRRALLDELEQQRIDEIFARLM